MHAFCCAYTPASAEDANRYLFEDATRKFRWGKSEKPGNSKMCVKGDTELRYKISDRKPTETYAWNTCAYSIRDTDIGNNACREEEYSGT